MARRIRDRDSDDGALYLVPADDTPFQDPDAVRALAPGEPPPVPSRASLPEILFTAAALATQRNCPADVVSNILAFAGLLLSFESHVAERVGGDDNMNHEYVRLDIPTRRAVGLPPGVSASRCVLLAVECSSKDQGWASFEPEHNGTYRGSSTWVEVAVRKPTRAAAAAATSIDGSEGDGRVDRGSGAVIETESDAHGVTEEGDVEVARVVAFCNLRAARHFRRHVKLYKDPTGLVRNVELGDSVSLVLRSQYPGWTNTANFGRITAFFELEFDEFSFADVPFPASLIDREGASGGDSHTGLCSVQ
ncbi:hypothetical protein PybrP1_007102 [[Pythium] brassicae (nom. inval.)]|nr:hypothetical protein PybrP1_007102 [[Pythium] brassicae (nom. inval.)]